jgi:hypothetical protein
MDEDTDGESDSKSEEVVEVIEKNFSFQGILYFSK